MPSRSLVVGSRGSRLALAQAEWILARLRERGCDARLQIVTTTGDRQATAALEALGGEGIFVKEIQAALLAGTIDVAVHSCKDLPTTEPSGLLIAAVPERADPRDLLVAHGARSLRALPTGALVGTGSPRRVAQARRLRPDLAFVPIRGNVDTRVAKWRAGACDALLLASAGIARLSLEVEGRPLDPQEMLPAVAQGALAIETRGDDAEARTAVSGIGDAAAAAQVAAERAFLAALGGGCRAPIAALAERDGDRLRLRGLVIDPFGRRVEAGETTGDPARPEEIGRALAAELLARGAALILARAREADRGAAKASPAGPIGSA
ncbi:MAG TPA: hydroxymethylbilane synthase [Verrucomicrobiae bacterium]|nr:hydroxymethylbilane synthase [Verrucomicrobiae bacterium]